MKITKKDYDDYVAEEGDYLVYINDKERRLTGITFRKGDIIKLTKKLREGLEYTFIRHHYFSNELLEKNKYFNKNERWIIEEIDFNYWRKLTKDEIPLYFL